MTKKIEKESMNIPEDKLSQLKLSFPETFSEGKIDFERLKVILGGMVDEREEKYSFSWAGRSEAIKNLQITSKGTLIADKKESVDFDSTENLFVEGDNLEVLKLLLKSYFGKVKMIYIDPPYNTGNDFVYKDDFRNSLQSYLEQTGQSKEGVKLTTNPETSGRYHSDWLSMMYPRLFIARNLLKEDGVIFVSIDDNEVHNLRMMMNEIFGEENFVAQLVWENREGGGGSDSRYFKIKHEYLLVYSKQIETAEINGVDITNEDRYTETDEYEAQRGKYLLIKLNSASIQYSKSLDYPIKAPGGSEIIPSYGNKRACWRWSKSKVEWGLKEGFIVIKKDKNGDWAVYTKQYLKVDNDGNQIERSMRPIGVIPGFSTTQANNQLEELFEKRIFEYSKPYELMKYIVNLVTKYNEEDLVLDFFAGSGTTAQAVFEQNLEDDGNRKFILVQLPEPTPEDSEARKVGYKTIADIGKERIRKVIKKIKEEQKQKKLDPGNKQDLGFKVFKLSKSNYKIWENYEGKDLDELKKQMTLFKDSLVEKCNDIDVIYECIIKEGYSLNSTIEKLPIKSNIIYSITDGDQSFYITLDTEIKEKSIDELKLTKDTLFICRDGALSDSKKVNLSLQCNLKAI